MKLTRRKVLKGAGPVLRGDPTEVHPPKCRRFSGRGLMRRMRVVAVKNGAGTGCAQVAEWLMAADCKSAGL